MIFTIMGIYTNYMLFYEIYHQHEIRISKMYLDFCKRVYSHVNIQHWTHISLNGFDIPEMARLYAEINPRITNSLVTMIINAAIEMTPIDEVWFDSNKMAIIEAIPDCNEYYIAINEFRGLSDQQIYTGIFVNLAMDIGSAVRLLQNYLLLNRHIQVFLKFDIAIGNF